MRIRIRVLVNKLAMPCECASLHIYADFWIHYESSHRLEQSACGCHSKCPSVTEGSVYPLCLLLPLPFVAFALSLTASDFWFVSLRHSTGGASNVNCQVGISGRKNLHNLLSWISDKPQRDNRPPPTDTRTLLAWHRCCRSISPLVFYPSHTDNNNNNNNWGNGGKRQICWWSCPNLKCHSSSIRDSPAGKVIPPLSVSLLPPLPPYHLTLSRYNAPFTRPPVCLFFVCLIRLGLSVCPSVFASLPQRLSALSICARVKLNLHNIWKHLYTGKKTGINSN